MTNKEKQTKEHFCPDFRSDSFLQNSKKVFKAMHDSGCPFAFSEKDQYYAVASYDEAREILGDHDRWENKYGAGLSYSHPNCDVLLGTDPPLHTTQVNILAKAFNQKKYHEIQPALETYIQSQLQSWYSDGQVDIQRQLFKVLPAYALCTLLGLGAITNIEKEWPEHFAEAAIAIAEELYQPQDTKAEKITTRAARPESAESVMKSVALMREFIGYCKDGMRSGALDESSNPVCCLLTTCDSDGFLLSEEDIFGVLNFLLLAAGTSTTILLGNITYRLLSNPEQFELIKNDRRLVEHAIEETLRIDSPINGLFRTNREEETLGPYTVKKDSKILMLFSGANLDPKTFDAPDTFNILRELSDIKKHLSFGYGIHYCRGAELSKIQARCVVNMLIDNFIDLKLIGEPIIQTRAPALNGFESLTIGWVV
ncbi:cytochrome P450 [Parendozoicomonas haliclonae]|uniref:Cytochrome P450 107B1 n=1 Tax=Parendozoicomonas haliclonae TaxID=1960125 RepID=A0A1X7AI85_9GAMM|nr:cytochrome P450 [Parendozoicomonas haliclonae]SMA38225.1 Cytochrome P450 107B1 [Parendozoicomonas haliclonae]